MALSYDTVQPDHGTHRRGDLTGADRALDIATSNGSFRQEPKHCRCTACLVGMPHVRRRESADVLGSVAV